MAPTQVAVPAKTKLGEPDMARILIVEDEPNMVAGLRDNFEFEGYQVITAPDGVAGLERALSEEPDLVILDVMMPRMSGLDVCKQLKSKRPSIPIIMLTARGQEIDKVVGLELGADDYVTKPFSVREVLARINAVLRRSSSGAQDTAVPERESIGGFTIDRAARRVWLDGSEVRLTGREVDLLSHLLVQAQPAIQHFGLSFFWKTAWNPVKMDFGALPFIYGTLLTSAIALAIALPVGVGVAVFLAEPGVVRVRSGIGLGVELLAAIPS